MLYVAAIEKVSCLNARPITFHVLAAAAASVVAVFIIDS